jgi:hypothetical protein
MEFLSCIFTEYRKDPNNTKPPVKIKEPVENKCCSYIGCMLEFTKTRPSIKKAKIGQRCYDFCDEYCYLEWLRVPMFNF